MGAGIDAIGSVGRYLRDRAYDTVFEIGDTSLQFIGDMFRGYNEDRFQAYAHRRIDRYEHKHIPKSKPTQAMVTSQKPLTFSEKNSFAAMMGRQRGESIVEHWKRQKNLLAYPDKQSLIMQHEDLKTRVKKENIQGQQIEVELRSIAKQYQNDRVPKQIKNRIRKRSR